MNSSETAGLAALGLVPLLFILALALFAIICGWKVFVKAGRPGWGVLIPIYNVYLWCKIGGKPGWWVLLFFIPIVSLVIAIILTIEIAKAFGKSTGFAILMLLLPIIALPILAFGDAVYTPPAATPSA